MKLRKLIVSGFKSFADKTEFEFDDGISCVVGPNGCGKSNVVDAIKWVLGEQSAKSLRGTEMMDVIFNGSVARRPSGQASVTLQFEGCAGQLQPVVNGEVQASDSVSITRRLFRSGQSEYLINKQPARLRDIKEMFLDTGLGANAYSIIEQGRVSQFLQASQEERRAFFDEAAGISRYKRRKKEAASKLGRVEQNLLRLQDILSEVEKRLRSIKIQAGKARNYQTYAESLRELRGIYFLSQYHLMKLTRQEQQGGLDVSTDRLASITSRIGQLESSQAAAQAEAAELEQASRQLQAKLSTLSAQITTLQERADMQANRVEELSEAILMNVSRCEELEAKIDDCAKDAAAREVEIAQVLSAVEELQQQSQAVAESYAAGEMTITELKIQLDEEKAGVVDLLRRTTQLHNDVHAIGMRRQSLEGDKVRLTGRAEEVAEDLKALLIEHAQVAAKRKDSEEIINEAQAKLEEVQGVAEKLSTTEQELVAKLSADREQRSTLAGRAHSLQEMQQRLEGVAEGTKRVLNACREGRLPVIHGMLGDYLETDIEHAPLVEAALSGADQRLLGAHFSEVHAAAAELEEVLGQGGSVEVICLDRVGALPEEDVSIACPQSIGRVLDWVRFEPWLEPLMWHLLGHTLLVRDLDAAALAARVTPEGYRFVTLAGEVFEADGRIRLGAANQAPGVIARGSELAELQQQIAVLDEQIENLQLQSTETRTERENLEHQLETLRKAIYEANFERGECDKQLAGLDSRIDQRKREEPLLHQNISSIEAEIDAAIQKEHETKEKAADLEYRKVQHDETLALLEEQLDVARTGQDELNEQRTALKVALASQEQKALALRETIATLTRQRGEMEEARAKAQADIELDKDRRTAAQNEIEKSRTQVEQLYADKQALDVEFQDIEESRTGLAEMLDTIRTQMTEKRREAEQANEEVGNLRVKLSEIDAHIGDMINRAADEMHMNLTELHKTYEHDDDRDWEALELEMNDLRGKIDRLGNVNLDAIGEQEELEQRHEYLGAQMQDIVESQKQLEELIRKLNKECRDRFVETFAQVRENFQSLFRKLFGGGKADVLLTDPEDVLESGIEIVARPPGKELRSISLLSGGEKTMAALAMIFSFFQAKPSPFCLLDEVDAALDEANNERYNAIVQEFTDTQFIMISHSKRTMAIAKVLYGVTMQELGVSKRISVKFEEADQLDETLQPVMA